MTGLTWAGVLALVLSLVAAGLMVAGWVLMLLVGVWHGMRPAVPPIGYGEAVLVLLVVNTVVAPALTGGHLGKR